MFKNIPNRVGMVFPILFITKPVNRKGNQSSIFIGRADAETPILDAKNVELQKAETSYQDSKIIAFCTQHLKC